MRASIYGFNPPSKRTGDGVHVGTVLIAEGGVAVPMPASPAPSQIVRERRPASSPYGMALMAGAPARRMILRRRRARGGLGVEPLRSCIGNLSAVLSGGGGGAGFRFCIAQATICGGGRTRSEWEVERPEHPRDLHCDATNRRWLNPNSSRVPKALAKE
jgi:hypothetical protein